jgi:Zn-dependent M28 family amino/carboxypeptidase
VNLRASRVAAVVLIGAAIAVAYGMWRVRPGSDLPQPAIEIQQLAERLRLHVDALAGRIGPRHVQRPASLEAAAIYVEQQFLKYKFSIERQPFDAMGTTVANVEARLGEHTPRYFVMGAHYDTVPTTPGANDNASGVAVLLELARLVAESGNRRRVRFVAFVNEEPPWFQTELMGSLVYAARARARGDDIDGMIALETMGYYSDKEGSQRYPHPFQLFFPSTGDFLAAVSNGRSFGLLRRFTRAFKSGSPLPLIASPAPARIPGVGWSDHWAFWRHGYRALLLTDTAPYRYPHYHASSDTPDKLDYVRLAWATQGIAKALGELAP